MKTLVPEFYENFEEVMEHFKKQRKQKADLIDELIAEKSKVFTSKFPVYSTALRSHNVSPESYFYSPLDKHYYTLTSISLSLRNASPVQVPLHLYQAQKRVNELWKTNFDLIDKKSGWIRGRVTGGELNYSSRAVIILDPTLPVDMVDVPYRQFLELFKEVIERKIQEDRGWSLTKTKNYLSNKFIYDDYVYSIMERIIREESPSLILNWGC